MGRDIVGVGWWFWDKIFGINRRRGGIILFVGGFYFILSMNVNVIKVYVNGSVGGSGGNGKSKGKGKNKGKNKLIGNSKIFVVSSKIK